MKDITFRISELLNNFSMEPESWATKAEFLLSEALEEIESLRAENDELNREVRYLERYQ